MRFLPRVMIAALLAFVAGLPVAHADASSSVALQNLAFTPKELHIAPGSTVTWNNFDDVQHSVTSSDGYFDSGLLDPGTGYALTFTDPGTYAYYCIPHGSIDGGGMAGVIVVDSPA